MSQLLASIQGPADVKALNYEECDALAAEIREFLIDSVSKNGGHLSSNLGDVELTLALHRSFDAPHDKIVWDVGHQAYTHKIITGRKEGFEALRCASGVSGFPRSAESEYDLFNAGHASDSVSLAYGLAVARDARGEDYSVVCVIGDGALAGGLSFEAINDAGKSRHKMIIVLNDNGMAIAHSVGSLSNHLSLLRSSKSYLTSKRKIKSFLNRNAFLKGVYRDVNTLKDRLKYAAIRGGIIFEEMGLTYLGPVNGHDIKEMEEVFEAAREIDKPVIIHVKTQKGKGYAPAEQNPEMYHGVGPFDPEKGIEEKSCETYSALFGRKLVSLAEADERVHCITAAMSYGCGLSEFESRFPDRFHDVGIAEAHGAAFAAGMARAGLRPYYAVYSTFAQRAYDQILEDIALNKLPVTLAMDRSGISGPDGETHQGIFDLAFLSHIPNLPVMAPSSAEEFEKMMEFTLGLEGPAVIRYPKGRPWHDPEGAESPAVQPGKGRVLCEGKDICFIALGACVSLAYEAALMIEEEGGSATVFDARFASPIDRESILKLAGTHRALVSVEDAVRNGGLGEQIGALLAESGLSVPFTVKAYEDEFIAQGSREALMAARGMTAESLAGLWRQLS